MAENGIKVSQIAKDLKVTGKEVVEKLAGMGIEVKSTAVLSEEQLGIVFDIFTAMYDLGDAPIEKPPLEVSTEPTAEEIAEEVKPVEELEKKEPEKETPKPIEPKRPQGPVIVKKAEPKKAAQKKPEPKKEAPKTEDKSEPRKEQKKPQKQPKKSRKAEEHVVEIPQDNEKEYVIHSEDAKKMRYVDTRTSTVELDKVEERERLESMVNDDDVSKLSNDRGKKHGKKQQQNREKEMKQQKEAPKKKEKAAPTEIEIPEMITVGELASKLAKGAAEVVKKLMMLGVMATITQSIDYETAALIAADFGIDAKPEIVLTKEDILFAEEEDKPEDLEPRPPVVVVMGHVDHGKTSLLDAIRHTSVTNTEAGGITQHIGAYSVTLNDREITFLDTPGHEAFTTMRARGAQVTDVAILVVAADDGIMPQTIEAINHAKAAGVTIVVAINKIDKEGANVERVKQMLVEQELIPEEWGGDTVCVEVSAKQKINIDGLLEMVLLIADMKELKANPNKAAKGTVIESRVDKGRGPVATVLVQEGTLHVGDIVIAGTAVGHVRAMTNDKGRRLKVAGPSVPVEIQGLSEAPMGGEIMVAVKDEKLARDVAESRRQEQKENRFNQTVKVSLDNLFDQIDEGNMKELNLIIKADVQGSVEAVRQSLEKLSNEEVRVRAIHGGVGAINESDVMLANASNAIIVGFNVRPDSGALAAAASQDVDIRLYRIIYQAIEEIEAAMKGMLDPKFKEVVIGHAEIRQTFKVSGVGTIAGAYVTDGKISRNAEVRLVRDGIVLHEGKIGSLKRFKDDAKEVSEGFECGTSIDGYNDIKEGDVMECFVMEEIER